MTRPSGVPEYAELIDVNACLSYRRVPSRFAPEVDAKVDVFQCPACHREMIPPRPGESRCCSGCALFIYYAAAGFYIWKTDPAEDSSAIADPRGPAAVSVSDMAGTAAPTTLTAAALDYLKHVLRQTKMSPTSLALRAGMPATTLTRALNGHKFSLSLKTLEKIRRASGVDPADFLERARGPAPTSPTDGG